MLTFSEGFMVADVLFEKGHRLYGGLNGSGAWTGAYAARYVVGEPCDWATLGALMGPQPAKYMTDNPLSKAANRRGEQGFQVHCQDCGKVASKARGGEVLTRKTVVCGKCYDEAKHGAVSTVTHYHGQEVAA